MVMRVEGFFVATVLVFAVTIASSADVVVPIQQIIARPEGYHLKTIQVEGIATHVETLPPTFINKLGALCWGAYTFVIADETGSLQVEVPSLCGRSKDAVTIVTENERVSAVVRIEAPGYYTGQGIPPPGKIKEATRAILIRISKVAMPE